jgi:hypothetical protein
MALLINNAKFKNTEVTAPQIYARLQYVALPDGKTTAVSFLTGLNKAGALAYESIATNLPEQLKIVIPDGQAQDLATIHEVVKTELETKGFEVTIDLA